MRSAFSLLATIFFFQNTLTSQSAPFQLIYGNEDSQEVAIGSIQVADGSIYMVGNIQSDTTTGQDVLLVKVSPMGEVIWSKTYDNGQSEFAQDFILKNGQFIIAGESNSIGVFDKNAFILKVDTDGNLLAFSLFGEPSLGEQFQSIAATETGYIACGYISSTTGIGNDVYVRYFGAGLVDSWEKVLGVPVNDIGMSVAQLPNGNYVLCGDRLVDSVTYNAFVMILDHRGEVLHETVIASPHNGGSKNLIVSSSGDILVVGEMATPTSMAFDIFLAKISPQGELLWVNYVPSTDASDAGFGLCEVNPGSLVITGYSYNEAAANTDIVAISVDSLGLEVDRKYFGGPGLDIAYDVKPSLSGGLLIAGKTSFTSHQDAILIHDFLALATGTNASAPQIEKLDISPNPAPAGAALHLPNAWLGGEWQLVDVVGKKMAQGVVNQPLVVGELPAGTYFLWVKKAGKAGVGKLVVSRF